MEQEIDDSKIFFNDVHIVRQDIVKEVFELLGYDLEETIPNVKYRNYMDMSNSEITGDTELTFDDSLTDDPVTGPPTHINVSGDSVGGVFIPDSIKKNQRVGKCPSEFLDGVKKASAVTGIPVEFYVAFGFLESNWRNCNVNSSGYGGYFGQKPSQGGTGSVYDQATKGIMVDLYKEAKRDAAKYGFSGADLIAWCYLAHNAGPAGARTMLKALNGNLRQDNIVAYQQAATEYVRKHGSKWSLKNQVSQIQEKTLSIPKAYYVASQISKALS